MFSGVYLKDFCLIVYSLGWEYDDLCSGTPFPCPLPIPFPCFKSFWIVGGMGVVWKGGLSLLGVPPISLDKACHVWFNSKSPQETSQKTPPHLEVGYFVFPKYPDPSIAWLFEKQVQTLPLEGPMILRVVLNRMPPNKRNPRKTAIQTPKKRFNLQAKKN